MSETTYERMRRIILTAKIRDLDPNIVKPTTLWIDICKEQSDELDLIFDLDEEFVQEFPTHLPVHAWGKGHTLQRIAGIIDEEITLKAG